MKRYLNYKDSNIDWIGEIPDTWQIKKIKHGSYVKGRIGWKGLKSDEFLTEGYAFLITGTDFKDGRLDWDSCYHIDQERYEEDHFIQLKENDLLITKDGTIGKVALVKDLIGFACLNSGIFLVRPINGIYETDFLYWILNSNVFNTFINYRKTGSTISHLYQNVFVEFDFPVPTLEERKTIANFLDHKTQLIDDLIAKKERLIELLREERTAVINQAVTKGLPAEARAKAGLDPSVPMKDTGIEWLGEIPEHWGVKKLKYLTDSVQTGSTPPSTNPKYFIEPDIDWFTPVDFVNDIYLNSSKRKISTLAVEDSAVKIYKPFTVLVIGIGATLGKVGIIKSAASSNQQINALEFADGNSPIYYAYYLQSIKPIIRNMSYSATLAILNQNNTRNILMLCPPKSEQNKIGDYIEKMNQTFNNKIELMTEGIKYLVEYKTSLINEAVTGKIDVRDYQVQQ